MIDYNRAEFERIFGGTLLMIIGKDGEYDSSLTYWAYKGWVARQLEIDTLRGEVDKLLEDEMKRLDGRVKTNVN